MVKDGQPHQFVLREDRYGWLLSQSFHCLCGFATSECEAKASGSNPRL